MDGLQLMDKLRNINELMPVLVISGHGTIETAVTAIRKGAYDFLEKPFTVDKLVVSVQRALEAAALRKENSVLKAQFPQLDQLIGNSSAISNLKSAIGKVASTNSRIMITGPAGAGKELVARLIHTGSVRCKSEFLAINAAAIAPERMESELFGEEDENGEVRKIGLFEQAHRGTLYLDEVGDMPKQTQSKILRVLVDQSFKRVGGTEQVGVDVRVISSTSRDLMQAIGAGQFREDLFHRLSVVPISVPSLIERREDIPLLVDYFVSRLSETAGLSKREFADDAIAALQTSDWPGNVRQLRNNVERLLILTNGDNGEPIRAADLPGEVAFSPEDDAPAAGAERLTGLSLRDAREQFERQYLAAQISRFGGNISKTATFIGMERSALHRKLKALGIYAGKAVSEA